MAERISRRAEDLLLQLSQAISAITDLGAGWPTEAPTAMALTTVASAISADISEEAAIEAALKVKRQTKAEHVTEGRGLLKGVDGFTDGLYGKDGAEKAAFGLAPILPAGPSAGPIGQVVIVKIADGSAANSIFVDFDAIDGASSYEAEWFTSADLSASTRVGNITITQSEFTAGGLTKGQQYWFRVRAIRANQSGPWSDPATRVAGL